MLLWITHGEVNHHLRVQTFQTQVGEIIAGRERNPVLSDFSGLITHPVGDATIVIGVAFSYHFPAGPIQAAERGSHAGRGLTQMRIQSSADQC